MTAPPRDRAELLRVIRTLPPDEQQLLAQEILGSVHRPLREEPRLPHNFSLLDGLLATTNPPPTDEEVARWLDERRTAKYGA